MRALVTGATGKVGHATARALVAAGHEVRALVRDAARAGDRLPAGVAPVPGDVTVPETLPAAVAGCEVVFNAMGLPEQWLADAAAFERVNARGTENIVRAAREAGVRRVVHTSTIDVFHAEPGARFDESALADYQKGTAYERSKQRAEELAVAAAGDMELVFVNPAAVYGLGPPGSASLERQLFEPLVRGRLPALVPGGFGIAFSEGVGAAQLLAAERGRPGEHYIVCDAHLTLRELAETVVRVAGRGRVPATIPVGLARVLAAIGECGRQGHPAPAAAREGRAVLPAVERRTRLEQGAARAGVEPDAVRGGRAADAYGAGVALTGRGAALTRRGSALTRRGSALTRRGSALAGRGTA